MNLPLHEDAQYFPSEIEELCPHGPGSIKQVWWGSMFALRRRFGPYYKVVSPMLGSIIFVHDPEFVKDIIMKQTPKLIDKGSDFNLAMFDLFSAHNVFTSSHSAWKKQRAALNQAFSDDAMMRVFEVS
jgi:cytochrome P450